MSTATPTPDPAPRPERYCRVTITSWRTAPDEPSPPTVENPDYHLRYYAFCSGCGHNGPIRSSENTAVEDGCDHAHPDWREMPVMDHRPYEGKPLAAWEKQARAVYPAGWFDREGPVRAYRTPGGTRHVPGYAPGGGYSMAVLRPQPAAAPIRGEQASLFG
ncbi:DUF6349 family protein [Streptosporangium longisporum]|uniref:Uncharacterized protein n=1 Tax=Streptosporangium longisporum TaxID=46187 RepID=A0ABP6L3I1_9ACTN